MRQEIEKILTEVGLGMDVEIGTYAILELIKGAVPPLVPLYKQKEIDDLTPEEAMVIGTLMGRNQCRQAMLNKLEDKS